jgi:uncharacterized iron-regulated membrane protein
MSPWFRVHSFTGVITGLLLFVICWSGTVAVISKEIDWLVTPSARVVPEGEPAGWAAWLDAVERSAPLAKVQWLQEPLYPASAATVVAHVPGQRFVRFHVDPHRSEVQGRHSFYSVQRFFRNFHKAFFGVAGLGGYLVALFGVTMLISLVAALLFYKRWWTRFFRLKRGGGRVFWSELHKIMGLWSLWFVLVIGLTGAWYLFEMARYDFWDGKISYAGNSEAAIHQIPQPRSNPEQPSLPLDALVERIRTVRPHMNITMVSPSVSEEGVVSARGQAGHLLVRERANQIHLDARTGEVLYNQNASEYPLYWRWSDTADPLHFGDFAGLTSKLIWFVFGLVLSGLILTGTWLHAHRLARDGGRASRHRWPGTVAALLVSLGVLAASVPYGFQQARQVYGPTVEGMKRLPDLAPGVEAVIIAWIVLTLAILAGWVYLLWRPERVVPNGPRRSGRKGSEMAGRGTGAHQAGAG